MKKLSIWSVLEMEEKNKLIPALKALAPLGKQYEKI